MDDLIFDIGFHLGEDTEFYLKKGFRVVAVEANPELAEKGEEMFADAVRSGRLTIVNGAISETTGPVVFHRNLEKSLWSTIDPDRAAKNKMLGAESQAIEVQSVAMADLF